MVKPEWGVKRTCLSCGTRFYDMARSPITCPKCGSVVEPEVTFKVSRRSTPVALEPKAVPVVVDEEVADIEAEPDDIADDDADVDAEAAEEDENGLIEDASDLGEDDDDMAEVMEHLDENLEDEV